MENLIQLAIIAVFALLLVRTLLVPVRLGIRSLGGFVCLWLLNLSSGVTGLALPLNAVTVLVAGWFGIPGIGLIALLEML